MSARVRPPSARASRAPASFLVLVVLLSFTTARAEDDSDDAATQQAEVQDRLAVERAALSTLKNQKSSVLAVIDLIDRRAKLTESRAAAIERELNALKKRRELAERQEHWARVWMQAQVQKLGPRLRAMYRLQRRGRLDVLLSADDFASLVWRTRALSTLLDRDLDQVRDTQRALDFQLESQRTLDRLQESVLARAKQLKLEREVSLKQQELLTELLARIGSDAQERSRLVRELEQAERRLSRMVEAFDSEVDDSAFAQLRGRMHWPAAGILEVGFGKVVNPRFNTVTFQKGIDIRARTGQPVHSVADGKVVYANWLRGYGNILIIDHGNGYHSLMAHLSSFAKSVGASVKAGDEVGSVGDTGSLKGAYLYFEIRKNGIAVDPTEWLGRPDL